LVVPWRRRRPAFDPVGEEARPRPSWYHDVWPWLAALGIVVLALVVGVYAYGRFGNDDESSVAVATVPSALGLTEQQGRQLMNGAGFDVEVERESHVEPKGTVVAQLPEPGTRLSTERSVFLTVSEGPAVMTRTVTEPARQVQVPDAVERDWVEASDEVDGLGLLADSYPVASSEPLGRVVSQNPIAGTQVAAGTHVRLNVSRGRPAAREVRRVPAVTGRKELAARRRARAVGFTVRSLPQRATADRDIGTVLTQRPAAGERSPELTQMTLYVGTR
jgi:serine/threonine-protein kinase